MFPFEKYPYTNFHDLNLGYFLTHFKEIFEQWASLYEEMQTWKTATDEELAVWKSRTIQEIRTWQNVVQGNLNQWEADIMTGLEAWKTAFETLFNDTFGDIEDIKTDAEAARDAALAAQTAAEAAATAAAQSAATFTTDTTLTIAGKAADAAITGQVRDSLVDAIEVLDGYTLAIFKPGYYSTWNPTDPDYHRQIDLDTPSASEAFTCAFLPVTPGDTIKINVLGGGNVQRAYAYLDADRYSIYRYSSQNVVVDRLLTVPEGAAYIIVNARVTGEKRILAKDERIETETPFDFASYDFAGKNIAIMGDSISTNGDFAVGNPLGNVPEIVISADDVGVALSAYATYYDVGTTIGSRTITAADIGTEVTVTPTTNDIGKMLGKPLNNNAASTIVWWEVAADILGFNPIPVSWSGSSVSSHEEDKDTLKTSYAWHNAQIRKCGIRTPGTMTRVAPDMIIIYRGTNDFSHGPSRNTTYSMLTPGYFDGYMQGWPSSDVVQGENDESYFGFCEAMTITVEKLRAAYPSAKIVLCTLNVFKRVIYDKFPTRNGLTSEGAGKATLPMYNDAIRAAANYLGCDVIEFDKDGITFENCYVDGYITDSATTPTHPNNKGHAVMGRKAIMDLIRINTMEVE